MQDTAAGLLLHAAIIMASAASSATPAAVAAMVDMGMIACILQDGFGSIAAVMQRAADTQSEYVLDDVNGFMVQCTRCLTLLMTGCIAARTQMAASWQATATACCRALPPDVLRQLLPYFVGITDAVKSATAAAGSQAAEQTEQVRSCWLVVSSALRCHGSADFKCCTATFSTDS